MYEVGELINLKLQTPLKSPTANASLEHDTCTFGDYTHDNDARVLTLCATSRGKSRPGEYLDVNGIRCRYLCPQIENSTIVK